MWRSLRGDGFPICSTWIDEAAPGQTRCWSELCTRCQREVQDSDALVLYWKQGEILKGSLVEVGMALASNVHVFWAGPWLSICAHRLVTVVDSLDDALAAASDAWRERRQ